MLGLASSWAFLFEHPVVGLIVFAVVSAGVIVVMSGGRLGESLGGMFRVAFTLFSTPFIFLSDALSAMRTSSEDEQDYRNSRVFMMFRLSKLQYLALLVLCLLMLSSGITSSVLTLYPSAEIEQGRMLDEQIERLTGEVAAASEAVAAAAAPGFADQLRAQRDEARSAYQRQVQNSADFVASNTFTGPIISRLASTRNAYTINDVRSNIDAYMSSCPRGYNWRGMTVETCNQYRAFVLELADRKMREIELETAATDADRAYREADAAAQAAANNHAALQQQLDSTRQAREAVSLFNPDVMTSRVTAALGGLLLTLWGVIITVWIGASVISLLSWLVLMMRGLELWQTQKLRETRAEDVERA